MKRTLALFVALIMLFTLAACAPGGQKEAQTPAAMGTPDALPEGEIGGEITVSCYDTMRYKTLLEEAAALFEQKYPGTKVNVDTFSAMPEIKTSEKNGMSMSIIEGKDDAQERADYIDKVSTALMSGEGADVLAMDILPIHKLAAGSQLEKLDGYMEADPEFNRAEYRENVLEAIKYEGSTWFIPTDYAFNYYAYDSALLSGDSAAGFGMDKAFSAGQLIEMAKDSADGESKLFNMSDYVSGPEAGMFGQLLSESYGSFIDLQNKKADFAGGKFAELLERVKDYSEKGYIPKGATGQRDAGEMMSEGMQPPTDRFYFKEKAGMQLFQQMNRNSGRRMNMVMMTAGSMMGIEDDDEIAGIVANADGSVPFTFEQAYGINANSKNKRTAWEFIKFLIGEQMQSSTSLSIVAYPINNAARSKKMELSLSNMFARGSQGQELDDAQKEVLQRYNEAVERLSDQINTYVFRDTFVDDMVTSEARYFFDGSKSAEDVARSLQSKAGLYLSE